MDPALARPDQPLATVGGPAIELANAFDVDASDGAAAAQTMPTGREGARQRRRLPPLPPSAKKLTRAEGKTEGEDEHEEPKGPKPVPFFALYRFATRAELCWLAAGLIAAAVAGAAQPLMTLILGRFTSSFTAFAQTLIRLSLDPTDVGALARLRQAQEDLKQGAARNATWLTIIGIGNFLTIYFYMSVFVWIGERLSKRLRERYLAATLRQNIAFFDDVGPGEVATRIQTDTHLVQEGTAEKVALTVYYVSTFVTGFILAYIRSWPLALAVSSILPAMAVFGGSAGCVITRYSTKNLAHKAASGSLAEEVLSTVRTCKAFGMGRVFGQLFEGHVEQSRRIGYRIAAAVGAVTGAMFFVIYCGYCVALVFGARLIAKGSIDSGIVVNVLFSIFIGSFSLMLVTPQVNAIFKAKGAAAKLYETIDRVPTIDSADQGGLRPATCEGNLSLDGVSFSYPSRPGIQVLSEVSVDFPAGKTAALVGSSGSGKTTIVGLLLRFYDPSAGIVRLDGRDIRSLNVKWLRQQIGYVQQEPVLFSASVRSNIEFGLLGSASEHAPAEGKARLVDAAARKANAHTFVELLPEGYDTQVGEGGILLSGGQKQRIAIARAIVSDPKILLLDEATSALDTVSEGVVQDALDKASAGRTTITIAHRLSTIKDAHNILVMGGGEVLESGSHDLLLTKADGAYARLVVAQQIAAAATQAARSNESCEATLQGSGAVSLDRSVTASEASPEREKLELPAFDQPDGSRDLENVSGTQVAPVILGEGKVLPYRVIIRRLYRINQSDRTYYTFGLIAALLSGFVFPGFAILFGQAISNFTELNPGRLKSKSDRTSLWIFIVAIVSAVVEGGQNWLFSRTADSLEAKVRTLSFRAMLRSDVAWFDAPQHTTGSLTSGLTEDATKITGLAGVTLGKILAAFATVGAGAVVGLIYGWRLALIAIACFPVILTAGYIELKVVTLKDKQNKQAHEDSAHLACEATGAIKTVASLTLEDEACARYSHALAAPLKKTQQTLLKSNALFALSQAANLWVIALVFWVGARWIAELRFDLNDFFVVLQSTVFAATQAGGVFAFVPDASHAQQSSTNVLRLLDQRPAIDIESETGRRVESSAQGHLRFNDVSFSYPMRPHQKVLQRLTFDALPGSYVALVGASGCGKSTTIQLIERFYDPLTGSITLDGVPISDLNLNSYRSQVALVSQEPTLYAGSVRFNILLGANKPEEEVTQAELEQACRQANILEFIESLPDGFDTAVGGKGAQLSGGQKQRIAIARALIRNPKVLLLDEATSALDSSSEKVVQAALDNAAKGRTTIAIAHRLSTIQNADQIFFFRDGRVAESGTHQQLLALNGGYAELVNLQVLSRTDEL